MVIYFSLQRAGFSLQMISYFNLEMLKTYKYYWWSQILSPPQFTMTEGGEEGKIVVMATMPPSFLCGGKDCEITLKAEVAADTKADVRCPGIREDFLLPQVSTVETTIGYFIV